MSTIINLAGSVNNNGDWEGGALNLSTFHWNKVLGISKVIITL